MIVDMSETNQESQIDLIGGHYTHAFMKKYLSIFGRDNHSDNNIDALTPFFSKIKNSQQIKTLYNNEIMNYTPEIKSTAPCSTSTNIPSSSMHSGHLCSQTHIS
jgi:hypothetical protein